MSDYSPSAAKLAHLYVFREWLEDAASGWEVSQPVVETTESGKPYTTFSLYCHGLPVALCESPGEALEKIGDRALVEAYEQFSKSAMH